MYKENTILEIQGLAAGYDDQVILSDISFCLEQGEVLVILGQNGSGKSTLLKTLGGLLPQKAGNIRLPGVSGKRVHPYQLMKIGLSFLPQGGLIMPDLTVREHLELATLLKDRKCRKADIEAAFTEFTMLREMQAQRAGNLSGGERQVLSFAMLLVQQSDTWLLDEPTAGLSPFMVRFTTDYLQRKNREGISMLLVEHNMEVAFQLASHIAIAKGGSLTGKFTRAEFAQKDFLDKNVYN